MKLDHIGIAVKSIKETLPFYEDKLGLKKVAVEEVREQEVKIAFLKIDESKFELLEPLTDKSPIARHIKKRKEGLQHVAIEVEDIEEKVSEMKEKGVQFLTESPSLGAEGMKIIFIHPKSSNGVLMELCEHVDKEDLNE